MGDADGGLRFVDVLSPRAGGAVGVDLQVLGVDVHVHLLRLRQHRHGSGAGLNAAAGLGFRDPLYLVDAALEFQAGEHVLPLDEYAALLDAAQLRLAGAEDLRPPAPALGVHGVHPQQLPGEEGRLLAAHAGTNLQDDVPSVVGVPGQKQPLQLPPEALRLLPGGGQLLLGQGLQLRVTEKGLRLLPAALRRLQGPGGLHHRRQLLELPLDGRQPPPSAVDGGVRQLGLQILLPHRQLF